MSNRCPTCSKENQSGTRICSSCNTVISDSFSRAILSAGTIIKERYKITKLIKTGGMGAVYLGSDDKSKKKIAIKELFVNPLKDRDKYFITRFQRETSLLSELVHPGLPRVTDYFHYESNYFIIMDYVEGKDLENILKERGNPGLPEDEVITWGIEICSILTYLHSRTPPVIYRDIKPANIIIREADKKAILIDFGLARPVTDGMSGGKTAIGTVGYSPPEQYNGRLKAESDIYALGATMHHLLTGRFPDIPFRFSPLRKINPQISGYVEAVIMKAVEFEVKERFSSASNMKEALANIKDNRNKWDDRMKKISSSSGTSLYDTELSKGHSNLGTLYARKGLYDMAIKELEKSIKLAPDLPEAYSNMGYIYLQQEKYEEAKEFFEKAIGLNSDLSSAYCNLGVVYSRTGQDREAINEFTKALRLNPDLAEAYINLAHIYGKNNNYREMMEQCKHAIRVKPEAIEAYINFAYACDKIDCQDDGIRKLEKAVNFDNSNETAFSNLGVLYGKAKKYDKAIKCFKKAISIKPDFALAYSNMGVISYKKGDLKEAKKNFMKAIEIEPNFSQAKANLHKFSQEKEVPQKEQKEIERLLQFNLKETSAEKNVKFSLKPFLPEDREKKFTKEPVLFEDGKKQKKELLALRAQKEIYPYNPDKYINLGNYYLSNNMYDRAIEEFKKALEIRKNDIKAGYGLALSYEKNKNYSLAEKEYKKIIYYSPVHFEAHFRLGLISFQKGSAEDALNYYLKALKLNGNSGELYYQIGLAYMELGKYKEGAHAFYSSIKREPEKGESFFNLGLSYYKRNMTDDRSEKYFKEAIKKKPDCGKAHLYLGNLYYNRKELSSALEQYKEVIDLEPDFAEAYSNLGAVYSDLDNLEEAEKNYLKALKLDNNLSDAHLNLGVLYQKNRDYKKAIKEMEIYLSLSEGKDVNTIRKKIAEMNKKLKSQENII